MSTLFNFSRRQFNAKEAHLRVRFDLVITRDGYAHVNAVGVGTSYQRFKLCLGQAFNECEPMFAAYCSSIVNNF
ncbi:hypothetical protein [Paraburkholderia sediminicola]|uniref:hypothetical protein n=1 Tax=Paraburkholderia sediminicola TaxID=458836 RepID=UPI0038B934AD